MTPKYSAGHAPVPGALPVLFLPRDSELERQTRSVDARPQSIVVIVTRHTPAPSSAMKPAARCCRLEHALGNIAPDRHVTVRAEAKTVVSGIADGLHRQGRRCYRKNFRLTDWATKT